VTEHFQVIFGVGYHLKAKAVPVPLHTTKVTASDVLEILTGYLMEDVFSFTSRSTVQVQEYKQRSWQPLPWFIPSFV
jgi:hypothetical protein